MDYTYEQIAKMIDHSLLNPALTDGELEEGCRIALQYNVASVCIKPYYLRRCAELLAGSTVAPSTVIGFPHGGNATAVKLAETEQALADGGLELDMVVNVGKVLSGDWDYVRQDIGAVVQRAHQAGAKVKVIFENCFLQDEHKIRLCQICGELNADWVKTSTGFGTGGATLDDLRLMRQHCAAARPGQGGRRHSHVCRAVGSPRRRRHSLRRHADDRNAGSLPADARTEASMNPGRWLTGQLQRLGNWWPRAKTLGQRGEAAAARFLEKKGYIIVARSDRMRHGELDLVAVDQRTVVFVEVKTRRSHEAGHPADAVDEDKQRRLTRLALTYLKRHHLLEYPARFDVVAVTWADDGREPVIEHYENAFPAVGQWQLFS